MKLHASGLHGEYLNRFGVSGISTNKRLILGQAAQELLASAMEKPKKHVRIDDLNEQWEDGAASRSSSSSEKDRSLGFAESKRFGLFQRGDVSFCFFYSVLLYFSSF